MMERALPFDDDPSLHSAVEWDEPGLPEGKGAAPTTLAGVARRALARPDAAATASGGAPLVMQGLSVGLFQDIPRWIWVVFLTAWGSFFLQMGLFFAVDSASAFMVTISMLFGVMAFGLPIVMARQSRCGPCLPCEVVQTHTGPVSVRAAAVQIALIPIAVSIGFMGFIIFAK